MTKQMDKYNPSVSLKADSSSYTGEPNRKGDHNANRIH